MPPDPPRGYRLRRAFIRTPLRQILDLTQQLYVWTYSDFDTDRSEDE